MSDPKITTDPFMGFGGQVETWLPSPKSSAHFGHDQLIFEEFDATYYSQFTDSPQVLPTPDSDHLPDPSQDQMTLTCPRRTSTGSDQVDARETTHTPGWHVSPQEQQPYIRTMSRQGSFLEAPRDCGQPVDPMWTGPPSMFDLFTNSNDAPSTTGQPGPENAHEAREILESNSDDDAISLEYISTPSGCTEGCRDALEKTSSSKLAVVLC